MIHSATWLHFLVELTNILIFVQCSNYSNKRAHGNICNSLCKEGGFIKQGCIHHLTTVVVDGILGDKKIVVKWKNPKWPDRRTVEDLKIMLGSGGLTNQEKMSTWKELIFSSMTTVVGEMNSKLPDVEKDIILENMKAPLIFDEEIAASFLSLTENDEYTMLGNFQELQHFPKLYGYCGQAYVMEKVIPYSSLFPAFVRKLGWTRTVKLAISFLDMVEELETAKGGPLQHCDIQEGNFGIADDDSIKLIDVDLILTKEKANEILPQPNCSSNSDCEFFDCNSRCDVERGRCLGKRITSNLQVLCRDIFKSSWPMSGLFGSMPSSIRPVMTSLLNDCSSARFGSLPFGHQRVQVLVRNLKFLLKSSQSN